jgi:ubiquitin-protein ligase
MSASSGANKRLITEITKLKALSTNADSSSVKFLLDKSPIDVPSGGSQTGANNSAQNIILGRILPTSNIYNQAAFQIEIKLPAEFPFKPPEVRFVTPIYHPNVDEQGKICVDLLNTSETWKPTTPLVDVVKAVVDLIDNPKIDHALNAGKLFYLNFFNFNFILILEIASEYTSNKSEFDRKALASVKKNGLSRS